MAALGEETWGERFARARNRSGLTLRQAAERISDVLPISHTPLVRLEQMKVPPTNRRGRLLAVLALLVYGYDPADFDVSLDDLPSAFDPQRLRDLLATRNAWSRTRPEADGTAPATLFPDSRRIA